MDDEALGEREQGRGEGVSEGGIEPDRTRSMLRSIQPASSVRWRALTSARRAPMSGSVAASPHRSA